MKGKHTMGKMKTALTAALLFLICFSAAAEKQPNMVLIFADDMGVGDVGCYYGREFETPHFDSIAENGVKFEAGYVTAAICGPSRAGLLSGRYQNRFGYETNPTPPFKSWDNHLGFPVEVEMLPEVMKRGGYATGCIGKWHMGMRPRFQPNNRGFDYFWGMPGGAHSYLKTSDYWFNWRNDIQENGVPDDDWDYLTDAIADRAVGFIERNSSKPFFLYVPFNAPHGPIEATQEYIDRVPDTVPEFRKIYAAMVIALDDAVGQILQSLREEGIEKETLVVFTVDNGAHRNLKSPSSPLNGAKGRIEEGGVRVPFVMQWPGTVPAGQVIRDPVCTFDLYATGAALAGVDDLQPIDGVNLVPRMTGQTTDPPHETLCWRGFTRSGVRHQNWKLIRDEDRPVALYNLDEDLGESNNLMEAMPEKAQQLEALYQDWETRMLDPAFPSPGRSDYAEANRLWRNKIDFLTIPPEERGTPAGQQPAQAAPRVAVSPDAIWKKVIHWDMETLTDDGLIQNRVTSGPYAACHLDPGGATLGNDPVQSGVLCFDGIDDVARSVSSWKGHKGVRVSMMVKSESGRGQSILLGTRNSFRVSKVAQSVRLGCLSTGHRSVNHDFTGALGLAPGTWLKVVAEYNPRSGALAVQCGNKSGNAQRTQGDVLTGGGQPLLLGDALNAYFKGSIDDVVIEVMD